MVGSQGRLGRSLKDDPDQMTTVGVAIPSIPPRTEYLKRALASVEAQTRKVDEIQVVVDTERKGAAVTRNAAMEALSTEWVCFLDDDDEMLPHHVERLMACQQETAADVVYPWFAGRPIGFDPFPMFEGKPWDNNDRHIFPIAVLMRRQLALDIGGFEAQFPEGPQLGEDWHFWNKVIDAGGKIVHLPERTWLWHCHGSNLSGQPRW